MTVINHFKQNFSDQNFDIETRKNVSLWLEGPYDIRTKETLYAMIKDSPHSVSDAFYTQLSFGTGGMRGIMGLGTNRMNEYTVRAATQGLANYLKKQPPSPLSLAVFIGYDSRNFSQFFAEESAKVLAANGISVYLCQEMRPTPLISFGCRHYKCQAAIMMTASHNPPDYNGYKVFWKDGGQILSPHDKNLMKEISRVSDPTYVSVSNTIQHPLIQYIGRELDSLYIEESKKLQLDSKKNQEFGKNLKIVYTSLHGAGITLIPDTLKSWGFSTVHYVDKQTIPDGSFPTVKLPNPEDPEALTLGIQELEKTHSDLLLANDPDADRVGVAVMHKGKSVLLSGNQIACLCLAYICEKLSIQEKLPSNAAFVKTIGTTELFQAICDEYQKPCINVLTGFKYIAEKIQQWETVSNGYTYIFGGEESFGYLLGTLTRDKDGIISSALISEVALHAKCQGKTLIDLLHDLYRKYGVFAEALLSMNFEESKEGKEKMNSCMEKLRLNVPEHINGTLIETIEDYISSTKKDLRTGIISPLSLPKSDVIVFWLSDKTKLMVRPSGTEPKIKLYCGVVEKQINFLDVKKSEEKASIFLQTLKQIILE